ncbi:MAG: MarR family transcriptional regulator [Chloroflexota bacterium]
MQNAPEVETLDFLLAQISRLHYQRAHELFNNLGLYRGQPPVLFALWEEEGLSHSELAKRLQITPATITKMIQRMEKSGFIKSQPDAQDQRISRVYLTEAGKAIRVELQNVWDKLDAENFSGFTPQEQVVLGQFLRRIRDNLLGVTGGKISI